MKHFKILFALLTFMISPLTHAEMAEVEPSDREWATYQVETSHRPFKVTIKIAAASICASLYKNNVERSSSLYGKYYGNYLFSFSGIGLLSSCDPTIPGKEQVMEYEFPGKDLYSILVVPKNAKVTVQLLEKIPPEETK